MNPLPSAVRLNLDLFSKESLQNPCDDYRKLRDAGPVVKLDRPDVYAFGRFADVQAALRAGECFDTLRDNRDQLALVAGERYQSL